MFGWFKEKKPLHSQELIEKNKRIREAQNKTEVLTVLTDDLKFQALSRKVAEQEIIIRRLLELVEMNIEHKAYHKYLLPRIHAIKNLLDKKQ